MFDLKCLERCFLFWKVHMVNKMVDIVTISRLKTAKGLMLNYLLIIYNRYEGTGRSLSLKLINQLRQQSVQQGTMATKSDTTATPMGRILHEVTLNESIRYAPGDDVEKWLNGLLCLDATVATSISSGCPVPDKCDLYP